MIRNVTGIVVLGTLLAGCASTGPASIKGGECRIFARPQYAVRGKRAYDQDWIDSQVEGGVGGCGWKRPAARPAALDAFTPRKAAPVPVRKRGVVQRIKDRFTGSAVPVPYVAAPIVPAGVERAPAPVQRDRVDELLRPTESRIVYPK